MSNFWENELEPGYYDKVLSKGLESKKGIQTNWHNITLLTVQKHINDSDKHLDYACGPGTLIGKYLNADSMGVDIAKHQIKYAQNKYGEKGVFKNIEEFDFSNYNNHFDIITVLGLIEFLSDKEIEDLLSKAFLALKKGGRLIITTPNFNSFIFPVSEKFGLVNWSGEHKNKFNVKKITNLINNSSFTINKLDKILNFGMLTSLLSIKLGLFLEQVLNSTLLKSQGFLLFVELKK
jgi:SAM-dependent methyltransferase